MPESILKSQAHRSLDAIKHCQDRMKPEEEASDYILRNTIPSLWTEIHMNNVIAADRRINMPESVKTFVASPIQREDRERIRLLMDEIKEVLLQRTDGCEIVVTRDPQFPDHKGRELITKVTIETWPFGG
jgi:hypothetical protein